MEVFATTMAKSGPIPFLGGEVGGFFRFVVSFQVVDPPSFGFLEATWNLSSRGNMSDFCYMGAGAAKDFGRFKNLSRLWS